ncbi:MAG: hypothetical protein JXX14_04465 [Deltaproteobacteria bacterium]|nr:hypothetical protein [Deltaproteobacteria bacterium]
MKIHRRYLSWLLCAPFLWVIMVGASGCAVSNAGKTVGRGTVQLEGSVGGPLFKNLGATMPVPNIPLGARYGFTDRLDGQAHVNVLPIVMGGFAQVDAGVTMGVLSQRQGHGVNLALSLGGAVMSDLHTSVRATPITGVTLSRQFGRVIPFVGFESYVDFGRPRAIGNVHGGVELEWDRISLQASAMWLDPGFDAAESTMKYVSPGNSGALGVLLGLKVRPRAWNRGAQ